MYLQDTIIFRNQKFHKIFILDQYKLIILLMENWEWGEDKWKTKVTQLMQGQLNAYIAHSTWVEYSEVPPYI